MGSGAATKKSQKDQGPLDDRLALRTLHLEDLWKPPMSATQNFFLCASLSLVELCIVPVRPSLLSSPRTASSRRGASLPTPNRPLQKKNGNASTRSRVEIRGHGF
jgi:hypothetical protein